MRVKVLSDLHLEFHREDGGAAFIAALDNEDVDVLVVAGDIGTFDQHAKALQGLSSRFPHVVFVLGNHDYYQSTFLRVHQNLERICAEHENLHWLHNSTVEIDGQRFVGTPLWFRDDPLNPIYANSLNDFRLIHDFRVWVYAENQKAVRFLERTVQGGDFVVTHHLPTHRSNERHQGSPLTRFFVCEMEQLLAQQQPKVWLHGHTHESVDYAFAETRVVCNPFGYLRQDENRAFDPHLVVVV